MSPRSFTATAAAALALLVPIAACSKGDDDGGVLKTKTTDPDSVRSTTTDPESGNGDNGDGDGSTSTPDGGGSDRGSSGDVPEDAALDEHVRTPGGMTLKISKLSFDGDDILVDAEFKNGQASNEAYIYSGNYSTDTLRLVDDDGQSYPLIESKEAGSPMASGQLILQPGDSVNGTFAFRGPLAGKSNHLSLVTNVSNGDMGSYQLADQAESIYPVFVVPMDLTWA
jgi:hypothetical protein